MAQGFSIRFSLRCALQKALELTWRLYCLECGHFEWIFEAREHLYREAEGFFDITGSIRGPRVLDTLLGFAPLTQNHSN